MKKVISVLISICLIFNIIIGSLVLKAPIYAANTISHADLISPRSLAYDSYAKRIIVVDSDRNQIFEFSIYNSEMKLIAGSFSGYGEDGLPIGGYVDASAYISAFNKPSDAVVLSNGAIIVVDTGNHAIRQIVNGKVTTIAGGRGEGNKDAYSQQAKFSYPTSIALGDDKILYIADTENNAIRRLYENGKVDTLAVKVTKPTGLAFHNGELYISQLDKNNVVKYTTNGKLELVTGSSSGIKGYRNGYNSFSQYFLPRGIAVDENGVLIADSGNHAVRKIHSLPKKTDSTAIKLPIIDQSSRVDTVLGGQIGFDNGKVVSNTKDSDLRLDSPEDVLIVNDRVFVADTGNNRIIEIDKSNELKAITSFEKSVNPTSPDIYIDGVKLQFTDVRPFAERGVTFVPVRVIAETFGAKVNWNAEEKAVEIDYNGFGIKLKDSLKFKDGRSFVPLRVILETFGIDIKWNDEFKVIEINTVKN